MFCSCCMIWRTSSWRTQWSSGHEQYRTPFLTLIQYTYWFLSPSMPDVGGYRTWIIDYLVQARWLLLSVSTPCYCHHWACKVCLIPWYSDRKADISLSGHSMFISSLYSLGQRLVLCKVSSQITDTNHRWSPARVAFGAECSVTRTIKCLSATRFSCKALT